ncbi:MAG TPA: Rrf2 family transcriptional regulator [Candidatus Hydrogenedentes bacterium]|nr:Rrf2 family transcriptional regulator [Candidatus Hydrogenedentota bacterium]
MNISSRCEYGCRAALALAHAGMDHEPVTAPAIAEQQHIPQKYLVHILLQLKRAGIIRSVRGAQGGYLLARPPEAITLRDVVAAIDGPILDPLPVADAESRQLASAWREVRDEIEQALAAITLQNILDRTAPGDMYYI